MNKVNSVNVLGAWDDLRFPLEGAKLDSSSGRLDYDFDECAVGFATNARYTEEPICIVAQFQHCKKLDSLVRPHLHWIQSEDHIPNWMIEYRWYNNGDTVPATYTKVKYTGQVITYSTGVIMQITEFPDLTPPIPETLSSILDIRLFRDSANASSLFAGSDPYTVEALAKEFDIHYQRDANGSTKEYSK